MIADQNECLVFEGDNICGLDTTDEDVSSGGDSGGPWFLGSTARGIHKGASAGVASYFTRVGTVANYLDATVLQD